MKCLFVTTGLDRAGAEIQILDLSRAYISRGHEVEVITLTKPIALVDDFERVGVPVYSLGLDRNKKSPALFWGALVAARKLVRELKPDVIHAHMVHANLFSRIAFAPGKKPPLISTAHNVHEGGKGRDWAYRLTNSLSRLNTTISQAATDRFISDGVFPPANTITVYNGIDIDKFRPLAAQARGATSQFRWISIGRLHKQKDYPTLLKAMQELPETSLDIYGAGPLRLPLEQLAHALGLTERVRFLGAVGSIEQIMPTYDGFVLASAWEGFGLVIAEAMACQLPVVATRSGGPQEILGETEEAGFLVAPCDPAALACAMRRLMALPVSDRELMGRAGRRRISRHFSINSAAEKWLSIYDDLIRKKNQ